jgi:hypothetical protein
MKTLTHSLQTLVMEIATNTADLKRFFLSTHSEAKVVEQFWAGEKPS